MNNTHPYDWATSGPPLGVWRTALGTAGAVMGESITFNADGTGRLDTHSAMRGNESFELVWRHMGEGRLQIICLEPDETRDDITDDMWETVLYLADWQTNDLGLREPILKNRSREEFWHLSGPIQLVVGAEN
ncbi:MAG: hypothetical protein CSA84_04940 [Actinomycetales bacterium]|nr:MAG: hypothetical protein CSA84_04940 [Actinomycetales bacterium]